MTREEERNNAAIEYANAVTSGIQDAWFDVVLKTHQDATAWSDVHPRKGLIDIDKVCDYLERLLYYDEHDGMLKCNYTSFDEFIEDLRKAMEE